MSLRLTETHVGGRRARVLEGGAGSETFLLLHGGWGDAAMHWSTLGEALASGARVIAPDLPGIGDTSERGLGSLAEYVVWLEALLDALGAREVVCVGSSFGGSLAWSFAGRRPERCRGVVLIDGVPMPRTPRPLLWLGRRRLGRALMRAAVLRVSFSPAMLPRAFADPARAPAVLREGLASTPPRRIETFVDCLVAGDGPPEPRAPRLVVWGERDRLPGTLVASGRALAKELGARLLLVADAGHFPSIEAPEVLARELRAFAGAAK